MFVCLQLWNSYRMSDSSNFAKPLQNVTKTFKMLTIVSRERQWKDTRLLIGFLSSQVVWLLLRMWMKWRNFSAKTEESLSVSHQHAGNFMSDNWEHFERISEHTSDFPRIHALQLLTLPRLCQNFRLKTKWLLSHTLATHQFWQCHSLLFLKLKMTLQGWQI